MNKNNLKDKPVDNTPEISNDNSGFLLGIISAVLLILCISMLLLFNNKQIQQRIIKNINFDRAKQVSDSELFNNESLSENKELLLAEKILDIKAEHSNGTIGRLTNISFTQDSTIVEMVMTNGFQYPIHLNLHGKGLVIVDDLGNEYKFKAPFFNSNIEIESGQTFKGNLLFKGGVTANAKSLTLITNSKIGSDQPFTRRPKIKFEIPISEEEGVAN